ncbi:Hint domain-containing protein [Actibacterium lipolyticum]|uniref:Hedgehog/Intein (Hint) domain-containing protein n=1 Tax=Actibacterium lipolyticum TaxID=1524263 RepID=A0A238JNE2_9RHOB|nr:Hint domain-containing protein [Actibacterium lipolyticum]SMX31724.1 hypothetical protein COL8621_00585 [Actibacterium lipolyticum]
MEDPHFAAAGLAVAPRASTGQTTSERFGRRPHGALPQARRYEIVGHTSSGTIQKLSISAPASPFISDAFEGFARGSLIATPDGPVAIEDLAPGMLIETADNGPQPLRWIGSTIISSERFDETRPLIRFASDSLGMARPSPDLILGPRARIMFQHAGCRQLFDRPSALAPARAMIDGDSIFAMRSVAPVKVYHLVLDGQQIILANGVETESFHPGPHGQALMDNDELELFLSLFPHIKSIEDFGPAPYPRLTAFELNTLQAG